MLPDEVLLSLQAVIVLLASCSASSLDVSKDAEGLGGEGNPTSFQADGDIYTSGLKCAIRMFWIYPKISFLYTST